ncbi:hypothetical protein ACRBEJ_08600 [Yersinia proxima]|uniref:hypothetical protein n=1 Tax=Yersinia proxima TaxID=2890316 RepID=UPI003D69C1CA
MSENTDYETLKAERDAALNACSLIAEAYNYELEPEHHIHAVPLFTAAKPVEDEC